MRSFPRVSSWCLAVSLLLVAGCGKKPDEAAKDDAKAAKDEAAKRAALEEVSTAPPANPVVPELADEVVMDEGAEDRSGDPKERGACLEGETCIGSQGCEAVWECDTKVVCKKGVREYCGCDGKTFETAFGNCPTAKYQYPGPCK